MTSLDQTLCDGVQMRAVFDLPSDEQLRLLTAGEPRVRVWAAWGLGLTMGEAFAPILRERLRAEPIGGVRRHLVVMLAGYGETDIVAAIARRDEDERARATATQYVAVFAANQPLLYEVLRTCLRDASPVVRAAAAAFAAPDAPADVRAIIEEIREGDEAVRRWMAALRAETTSVSADEPPHGELVPWVPPVDDEA